MHLFSVHFNLPGYFSFHLKCAVFYLLLEWGNCKEMEVGLWKNDESRNNSSKY